MQNVVIDIISAMMNQIIFLLFFLFSFFNIKAQILIDENFNDWNSVANEHTDPQNDGVGGIDFHNLKIYNDEEFIYFHFDTGSEINLQSDNKITLYIDIDDNIDTGLKVNNIGADFQYNFGNRFGYYTRNNDDHILFHDDIGFISMPTVKSDKFEMAVKKQFFASTYLVNFSNTINVLLVHNSPNGDRVPDNGGFEYHVQNNPFTPPKYEITKPKEAQFRVVSYNVERDNFFKNEPPFKRLLQATQPDIICFQEIYDYSSSSTKNKIQSYFGGTWYHAKRESDIIVISKYPIIKNVSIGGNGAFLVNIKGTEVLIINVHLFCCENDNERQGEVDQIMQFIRNAKNGTGSIPISKDTPIIITGDTNFVGDSRQRKTLIQGDISNEFVYGDDFLPDWDGSFFLDAKPMITGFPGVFTWYSNESLFPPGRLDYFIYSGSVLRKENAFVLSTNNLNRDTLDKYHLNEEDSGNASDHLPVVIDFSFSSSNDIEEITKLHKEFEISNYFPNPVKDELFINVYSTKYINTQISIIDIVGKKCFNKIHRLKKGENSIVIDTGQLPVGVYSLLVISDQQIETIKFIK